MDEMFRVDELIVTVANNNPTNVWGPVITINWRPTFVNEELSFQQEYNHFVEYLKNSIPSLAEYCFIYPYDSLHTTISTIFPATFGLEKVSIEERNYIERCSTEYFKQHFSSAPFDIKISTLKLSPDAGIFFYENNSFVDELRKQAKALSSHLAKGSETYQDFSKTPGIVHTTFLRFIKAPVDPILFRNNWDQSIQSYLLTNPKLILTPIKIDRVNLVNELIPYMQVSDNSPFVLSSIKLEN